MSYVRCLRVFGCRPLMSVALRTGGWRRKTFKRWAGRPMKRTFSPLYSSLLDELEAADNVAAPQADAKVLRLH
jgi:hypothetical protein